jgi:hypothetical protein
MGLLSYHPTFAQLKVAVFSCKIVDSISGRGSQCSRQGLNRKGRPGVTPNGFFMRLPVTGSVDIK